MAQPDYESRHLLDDFSPAADLTPQVIDEHLELRLPPHEVEVTVANPAVPLLLGELGLLRPHSVEPFALLNGHRMTGAITTSEGTRFTADVYTHKRSLFARVLGRPVKAHVTLHSVTREG